MTGKALASGESRAEIELWLAELNLGMPPFLQDALQRVVQEGSLGYGRPDPIADAALCEHLRSRFSWELAPESLLWIPGVVPALLVAIETFVTPGGAVLVPTPAYPPMLRGPAQVGRELQTFPLREIGGRYLPVAEDLVRAIRPNTQALLLCNPHNPTGTVWRPAELEALLAVARDAGLTVLVDEVHSDLVLDPPDHRFLASLRRPGDPPCVTFLSPGKAYAATGLACGIVVVQEEGSRHALQKACRDRIGSPNVLARVAGRAAYLHGEAWRTELLSRLRANRALLRRTSEELPGLRIAAMEGSFLAWIDARALQLEDPAQTFAELGVRLTAGDLFGNPGFLRLCYGVPHSVLAEALDRMRPVFMRERE